MYANGRDVNRHSHITIILLSVMTGALLAGVALYSPRAHRGAVAQEATPQSGAPWENAFISVADKTLPCVVSIAVETVGPAGGPTDLGDQLKDDPMFGPFFRDLDKRRGERQERRPRGQGLGSGWILSEDGYIVTNAHVVRDADKITVRLHDVDRDDKEYPAKLVGSDPKTELAVIKIEAPRKLPTLQLGDSKGAKVGQWVMAVGAPFTLEQTATVGIISAKGRELDGQSDYIQIVDVIQTDASINPGNSGGPLLDSAGRLIGINTAIISPSGSSAGIGFAVPVDVIKRVVPQLIEFGKIKRAGLGISLIRDDLARRWRISGVIVRSVVEGGPADRAGIRSLEADRSGRATSFDVIVGVDGTKVEKYDDLYRALDQREPGDEVEVRYRRGDREHKARVRLMELE